ncbi:RPII140-upstream gene protein [Anthophora quadrimaculata]
MLRTVITKRFICAAFFPFSSFSEHNRDENNPLLIIRNTAQKYKCYFYGSDGYPTKELQSVINTTMVGVLTGFIVGGWAKMKNTVEIFKAENQATLFLNKFEPKKMLQNKIAMNMIKGGLPYAMRLGTISFLFSSTSTFLYVYRGKFDPFNHIIGGAIGGFIYRINMGLKGVVAGAVLGSILGTISGLMTALILYISGYEMDDVYTGGYKLIVARREKIKESMRALAQEEDKKLKQMHERAQKINEAYATKKQDK